MSKSARKLNLTHQMPVLPSYKKQSIDFLCKSIDWFLYEGYTGVQWVKRALMQI